MIPFANDDVGGVLGVKLVVLGDAAPPDEIEGQTGVALGVDIGNNFELRASAWLLRTRVEPEFGRRVVAAIPELELALLTGIMFIHLPVHELGVCQVRVRAVEVLFGSGAGPMAESVVRAALNHMCECAGDGEDEMSHGRGAELL